MNIEISEISQDVEVITRSIGNVSIREAVTTVNVLGGAGVVVIEEIREVPVGSQSEISVIQLLNRETVVASERGLQGPQGEPGTGGGGVSADLIYQAGEVLSGDRCVVVGSDGRVYYASRDEPTHANKVLGITIGAAMMDADATVRTFGEMTEPSWNWILDKPIFLSVDGFMTQTPPTSGFCLIVAFPITSKKVFIEIKEPIFLQ